MKKKYIVATVAVTSLALLGAGLAKAGGERHAKRFMERGQKIFTMADTDKNGEVSLAEFQKQTLARFQAMDADNNQSVNVEEMKNHIKERFAKAKERRKKWSNEDHDHGWKTEKNESITEVDSTQ